MVNKKLLIIVTIIIIIIGCVLFFLLRDKPEPVQGGVILDNKALEEAVIEHLPDYNTDEIEKLINEPLPDEMQDNLNSNIEKYNDAAPIEGIPDDEFVIPPEDKIPDNLMLVQQDDGSWVYVELYPDGFESMDEYFEWLEQEVERKDQEIQSEYNDCINNIKNTDTENNDISDNYTSNPSIDEEQSSNNSESIGRNPDDYDSGIVYDPSTGQVAEDNLTGLVIAAG